MSNAIVNLITKNTSKKQMEEAYKNYPDLGKLDEKAASTVEPIICEIPKGASVLDVGCNSGELMKILKDKGCRVVGVDVSDVALAVAKTKRLRVLKASAEKLPFKDKRFDVVIMREVLTHIHEPSKAIAEAKRVLKKDGFFIGSVPHANLERIVWDDARLHHRYYDEEKLKFDLGEEFKTIHLRVLNGAQFMLTFCNSLLADKPAEILFKCGDLTPPWEDALLKDKKTLRVWMGPTQPPGDVYYRLTGYAEKMKALGVEVGYDRFSYKIDSACSEWQRKILPDSTGEPASALALHELEKCIKVANPLVFQLTYYAEIVDFFRCIKEAYPNKKIITECDDWLLNVPSYNIASNPYRPGSEKETIAFEQFELSDAIITSTPFIKEGLLNLFPNKEVHVIPNSIDFEFWSICRSDSVMEKKKDRMIRLAYTGCGNHDGDLQIVKPVLLKLLEEHENLEVIIAGEFPCFKDVKHPRFIVPGRWVSILEYPCMLKGWDFDIGIAPLRDNQFNRAKSNLRWLEYSALNIPTVASAVRPFKDSITHGRDGYLCESKLEWYECLKNLIVNENLRKDMGRLAFNEVKEKFNMNDWAKKYAEILRGLR